MANLKDVAQSAGVSVETVSRVLKGKYTGRTERSRETMRRVQEAAARLAYRPSLAARATRTSRSGLVGVIVEQAALLTHPVFTETLKGLTDALDRAGYIATITSLDGISETTLNHRVFQEQVLDGVFIVGDIPSDHIAAMRELIPSCVMINTNERFPACCVQRDERHAGLVAGQGLTALGYRRALYFEPSQRRQEKTAHYSIRDRRTGFLQGFNKGPVELLATEPGEIARYLRNHETELDARTVLVAGHDLRLFRLASALAQLSVRVGQDVGLATLDDETGLLSSFPEVSRVTFPRLHIGREAGRMMVALLGEQPDHAESISCRGEWLPGKTTPPVRPANGESR